MGRREGDEVILHPVEVLFLLEQGRASVIYEGREINVEEFFEIISSTTFSDRFLSLYAVYYDLRNRGHRAFPEYRINNTVVIFKKERPKIEVLVLEEGVKISLRYLLDWLEGVRKMDWESWVAIVDRNGNVTYYETSKVDLVNRF